MCVSRVQLLWVSQCTHVTLCRCQHESCVALEVKKDPAVELCSAVEN